MLARFYGGRDCNALVATSRDFQPGKCLRCDLAWKAVAIDPLHINNALPYVAKASP